MGMYDRCQASSSLHSFSSFSLSIAAVPTSSQTSPPAIFAAFAISFTITRSSVYQCCHCNYSIACAAYIGNVAEYERGQSMRYLRIDKKLLFPIT